MSFDPLSISRGVTDLPTPTNGSDAANKDYVDTEVGGVTGITDWGGAVGARFVGSGSPVGSVTPDNVGDLYVDETTPGLWQATGAADTDWVEIGAGGGAVSSVFTRTGAVVAAPGDYTAAQVTADSTTLVGVGTDVQAVLEELDNGIADHLADTSAAHAASAISNSPSGGIAATDVQAAINELDTEKASASAVVTSVAKTGSAALTGAVTFTAGTNITLTQTGNDITVAATMPALGFAMIGLG